MKQTAPSQVVEDVEALQTELTAHAQHINPVLQQLARVLVGLPPSQADKFLLRLFSDRDAMLAGNGAQGLGQGLQDTVHHLARRSAQLNALDKLEQYRATLGAQLQSYQEFYKGVAYAKEQVLAQEEYPNFFPPTAALLDRFYVESLASIQQVVKKALTKTEQDLFREYIGAYFLGYTHFWRDIKEYEATIIPFKKLVQQKVIPSKHWHYLATTLVQGRLGRHQLYDLLHGLGQMTQPESKPMPTQVADDTSRSSPSLRSW